MTKADLADLIHEKLSCQKKEAVGADSEEAINIRYEILYVDAEECIPDGLENGTLPHTVRSGEDVDAGGKGQICVPMRLDVFEMY